MLMAILAVGMAQFAIKLALASTTKIANAGWAPSVRFGDPTYFRLARGTTDPIASLWFGNECLQNI